MFSSRRVMSREIMATGTSEQGQAKWTPPELRRMRQRDLATDKATLFAERRSNMRPPMLDVNADTASAGAERSFMISPTKSDHPGDLLDKVGGKAVRGDDDVAIFDDRWTGIGAGLGLEVVFCCISYVAFGSVYFLRMIYVLTAGLVMRAVIFVCQFERRKRHASQASDVYLRTLFFWLSFVPFVFYLLLLDDAATRMCSLQPVTENIENPFGEVLGNITTRKIQCGEHASASDKTFRVVPLLAGVGIPLLFAFIFVHASAMFGVSLDKKKTFMQLAMLDFSDVVNFMTLPLESDTVFMAAQAMPGMVRILGVCSCWACATICFQVTMMLGTVKTALRSDAEADGRVDTFLYWYTRRVYAMLSLFGIDLWLAVVRLCFMRSHMRINMIFFGKNVLLIMYYLSLICNVTRFQSLLERVIGMMPNAEKVTKEADQMHARRAEVLQLMMCVLRRQQGEDVEEGKVREAFEAFDSDRSGTLSEEEIRELYSFIGTGSGEDFVWYIKCRKGLRNMPGHVDLQIKTDQAVRFFEEWCNHDESDDVSTCPSSSDDDRLSLV